MLMGFWRIWAIIEKAAVTARNKHRTTLCVTANHESLSLELISRAIENIPYQGCVLAE